jgi:hypothetical protein
LVTICVLNQGTIVGLQVVRDSANPIENGLRVQVDHMKNNYEI